MLVVDDVGLGQLKRRDDEPTAAHMLFTLLDRRNTVNTTALTSNIKLSAWGKYHLARLRAGANSNRDPEEEL